VIGNTTAAILILLAVVLVTYFGDGGPRNDGRKR
jgi:hypothetical protein